MSGDKKAHQSGRAGLSAQARLRAISMKWGIWPHPVVITDGWQTFLRQLQQWFLLELEMRRPFLFVPVAMMAGVLLYVAADREPQWQAPFALACLTAGLAWLNRDQRRLEWLWGRVVWASSRLSRRWNLVAPSSC